MGFIGSLQSFANFQIMTPDGGPKDSTLTMGFRVFQVAMAYYDWSGGQNFMQLNDFYNYALTGMKAYDAEFIRNGQLNLDHHAFLMLS